ncbi:hypothetical protein CK203_032252 [Vitis vinifera]|uniref:Uncharacterized protein n=1 Tax=Vitis vinifera TaxID=29760 RepID=A0A438IJP2_VITVI|nr:hypothetical protein CK203_032252 [Vitis vinifera]
MSERAREREREVASGENVRCAENRRKEERAVFGVESKTFELEMVERRGKTLVILTEARKGCRLGKEVGRLEGEGEKFLPGYVLLTGRIDFCDWGRQFGVEEIQYMYPEEQRGQEGMDGDGRGSSAVGY